MSFREKYYEISYTNNTGDFLNIPRGTNRQAYMVGQIIPFNILNPLHYPLVNITHEYIHNGSVKTDVYSAAEIITSTAHTTPMPGIVVSDNNYFYFENAISEVLTRLVARTEDISMFWSLQVNVPTTYISDIPALILCHPKTTKVTFSWPNTVPDPMFLSNSQYFVNYVVKYIDSNGTKIFDLNLINMTIVP